MALAPLRRDGLRIAVDDAGSGFASMRHVLHIRPDIVKLDRSLIKGINDDQGQRALGAALAEFARQIGPPSSRKASKRRKNSRPSPGSG